MIEQLKENTQFLAIDAPLTLPTCVVCELKCPGYENCGVSEIKWMRKINQDSLKKKPRKMFTPYTQRAVDLYLSEVEDENLEVQHALGSNLAPLTARAKFLKNRIGIPCIEVFPRLAVWRIGQELKINKNHLRSYRNSIGGEEARHVFLNALTQKAGLFLYQQDMKLLCENPHAFDALITAWVAYLKDQGKTESRPKDFPADESWVEFPK